MILNFNEFDQVKIFKRRKSKCRKKVKKVYLIFEKKKKIN